MPRIKLTKSAIDALPTPKADVVLLGCRTSRLRRQGHAEGPQGVYRLVPDGRCRLEAAKIYDRTTRSCDTAPCTHRGAEGARGKAGWPRSRRRKAGGQAAGGGRSTGGPAGDVYHPTAIAESLSGGDFETASTGIRKTMGGPKHS